MEPEPCVCWSRSGSPVFSLSHLDWMSHRDLIHPPSYILSMDLFTHFLILLNTFVHNWPLSWSLQHKHQKTKSRFKKNIKRAKYSHFRWRNRWGSWHIQGFKLTLGIKLVKTDCHQWWATRKRLAFPRSLHWGSGVLFLETYEARGKQQLCRCSWTWKTDVGYRQPGYALLPIPGVLPARGASLFCFTNGSWEDSQ